MQNVLRNVLCNLLAEVIFSFTTRAQDLKKGGFKKKNEVIDSKPVQGFKERAYENTRRGKGKATQPTFLFQILRFNVENEMKVKWGEKKKLCEHRREVLRSCVNKMVEKKKKRNSNR